MATTDHYERDNWDTTAVFVQGKYSTDSIGAVNPTLTIIANALRVGTHLLERLG